MFNINKNSNSKIPVPQALALSLIGVFVSSLSANAQSGSSPSLSSGNLIYGAPGTSTLTNPLVPGASYSLPGVPSSLGMIPAIGSGAVPLPPNPGMMGIPSTFIPWANGYAGNQFSLPTNQSVAPATQINLQNNQISLPVSNAVAMPPGVMNAAVVNSIPQEPSTPGTAPGILRPPSFYNGGSAAVPGQNVNSAAAVTAVGANGQLPNGIAPTSRPTRQGSHDYGLNRTANGYRLQQTSWVPQPGSTTTDFGLGDKALAYQQEAANQEASKNGSTPPKLIGQTAQISFNSPRPAQYPGQGQAGVPAQDAPGNHSPSPGIKFAKAQVTNDLYGIPMINPNKMYTNDEGEVSQGPQPAQTTIIPPPTN